MSEHTAEELKQQIKEYEEQLELINSALADDPNQPEFIEVKKNLVDVLNVTRDLLKLKSENGPAVVYDNIQEIATKRGFYVGMRCEARWGEDKQWYFSSVCSLTSQVQRHCNKHLAYWICSAFHRLWELGHRWS